MAYGEIIAKRDLYEIWVIPAEAKGWRATYFKKRANNEILPLKDRWFRLKADAVKQAMRYKKLLDEQDSSFGRR